MERATMTLMLFGAATIFLFAIVLPRLQNVGRVLLVICVALVGWAVFRRTSQPPPESSFASPVAPPKDPSIARAEQLQSRLFVTKDLPSAIGIVSPLFSDQVGDAIPSGAALFATWANGRLIWSTLELMPDNRLVDVLKDSVPLRGKKLCSRGTVAQIVADRSLTPPVYVGSLGTDGFNFVRFIAVHSTDGVVAGSSARFCGIVTGLWTYSNALGGSTTAATVVGMFDLPDNRD